MTLQTSLDHNDSGDSMVFDSNHENEALTYDETVLLRSKTQESIQQTLKANDRCVGIMVVGSFANLLNDQPSKVHKGSDLDIIPVTDGPEYYPDKRSEIAFQIREELEANLKSNGVDIKVECFSPLMYAYEGDSIETLNSNGELIANEMGSPEFAIIMEKE